MYFRRKDEHVMSNKKDPCLDASEVEKYDSAQPDCNITLKTKKTRKRQRRMTRKHVYEVYFLSVYMDFHAADDMLLPILYLHLHVLNESLTGQL